MFIINLRHILFKAYFIMSMSWLYSADSGENYLRKTYPKDIIDEAFLNTAQLIKRYKYPVETHHVITTDGYILGVHRIVNSGKPPVLLMHGLLDSSATWILTRPEAALGYYLYDKGYDVWMGNARGNRYSRNHTFLNPNTDLSYWRFSWHEIGLYDLSAMIDYVLAKTNFKKLTYFGHSQGTTAFWVLCSLKPEYNNKISFMHALGPVAFTANMRTSLLGIAQTFTRISKNKIYELLPHNYYLFNLCFTSKMMETACLEIAHQILGRDEQNINYTFFPIILGHIPAGCNLKQLDHYLQLIESKRFCRYDYGFERNLKYYGQPTPPDYPLQNVTVPVGLYYTYNDELSSEVDVKNLAAHLPNVVEDSLYPYKKWNHVTMLWGTNARKLAHKRMLELTKEFISK